MDDSLPRLDKTRLTVSSLHELTEKDAYWLKVSPEERLNAIELNRRMVYGQDRTSSRLQRSLEIDELKKR